LNRHDIPVDDDGKSATFLEQPASDPLAADFGPSLDTATESLHADLRIANTAYDPFPLLERLTFHVIAPWSLIHTEEERQFLLLYIRFPGQHDALDSAESVIDPSLLFLIFHSAGFLALDDCKTTLPGIDSSNFRYDRYVSLHDP